MDQEVYDALKEKLSDGKIVYNGEEKSLIDLVAYWEEGVQKTKAANKDLTTQREAWEKERKTLKESANAVLVTKEELEKKLETSQKKDDNGPKEELQKEINTLADKLNTLTSEYEASKSRVVELEEKALKANKQASEESLRSALLTGLTKHKIEGEKAIDAVAIINSQGYAKLIQGNDGAYEKSFCTVKDGKQLSASLDQLCKWIAETRPYLVSSSGKLGTGHNHSSSGPAFSTGSRSYYSMISNKG